VIAARMAEQQAPLISASEVPAGQRAWAPAGREVNPGTQESLRALQAQLTAADPVNTPQIFSFGTFAKAS